MAAPIPNKEAETSSAQPSQSLSEKGPQINGEAHKHRFIDIGINLTDPVYTGLYNTKTHHASDLPAVISRAQEIGCTHFLVTGSDLSHSRSAMALAKQYPSVVYATAGVHPCNCTQFTTHFSLSAEEMLDRLRDLVIEGKKDGTIKAFGEIGLDYDRLALCPKDIQVEFFAKQLDIASSLDLPLFLHSRAAHTDFVSILSSKASSLPRKGVVHSFTGTVEEMRELVELGWDIGVNGCSLKTEENCNVVKEIPLERLQLETDGPWCEIRPSHKGMEFLKQVAGSKLGNKEGEGEGELKGWDWVKKEKWREGVLVKGRNEPCLIGRVAWAVAGIKGVDVELVVERAWENSCRMFGFE